MAVSRLIKPEGYHPKMDVKTTEKAIKKVKDIFEQELALMLNLQRVSAPILVDPKSGMNDNLNGVERPVTFDVPSAGCDAEIVHSLAKWKRVALQRYGFHVGEGLYTDMNAIRRDEDLDNLHSIYVDQWDWEAIITKEQRNEETLRLFVQKIYNSIKAAEARVIVAFPVLESFLPDNIYFITTQELEDRYPDLTPKEREDAITKEYGAVFIMKIGGKLKSGQRHDGRAPDYDDWELNGDIMLWYPVLNRAFEVSSMGIRVDEEVLARQLELSGCQDRAELPYHKALLNGELPYTIGGGIGQSRICMYILNKAHIGEIHASLWSHEMIEECEKAGIHLL